METTFYFNAEKNGNCYRFADKLNQLIDNRRQFDQDIVYLCIGSDRSTGDSLGPLVGHHLARFSLNNSYVYGTLKNPVHAVNLSQYMEDIYSIHRNPFIIAIDASLGSKEHIGYVTLSSNPLKPGLGVKKQLQEVGSLSVTGIVNFNGMLDTMVLQTTRLSTVMALSDFVSNGVLMASHIRKKLLLGIL